MIEGFGKKYTNAQMLLSNMIFIRREASCWTFQKVVPVNIPYPHSLSDKVRDLERVQTLFDPTVNAELVVLMHKF